jgi:hypothetical protein
MNETKQQAVGAPLERQVRPGLLAFLRKIRACESEIAAQLVFEGWTMAVEKTERERAAQLAVDAASAAVKKYEDDPAPVRQPYANNRLMRVGWDAADRIRRA